VLLDHLMPGYDAVDRHATTVHAPADVVFAAIREADLSLTPAPPPRHDETRPGRMSLGRQ
jgi:hypothetical protein